MSDSKEPKGIGFYNIKSGETLYAKSEAQIQAFINSSDMGINASRGQDYGWRIDPEWVKKIREFRADEGRMALLSTKNNGENPTNTQVLYAIYGEQVRRYESKLEDDSSPYEEQYLQAISSKKTEEPVASKTEQKPSR